MIATLARVCLFPIVLVAFTTGASCSAPFASGQHTRSVRELIRDSDAAMAAATSYRVTATAGFDVNVLPSIGHVTARGAVVKPDSYVTVKAGSVEQGSLIRGGQAYSWDSNGQRWVAQGAAPKALALSGTAETGVLLALQTIGDFESLASDRSGTELLRYRLKADRVHQLTKTVLGLIIPEAGGVLDFASLDGNIDFDFYFDSSTHLTDEIVVSGDVRAMNIPVKITGSIKYTDYGSADIQLPDPNGAGARSWRLERDRVKA